MSDARGGHQAAVFVAIDVIGQMQEHLAVLTDLRERAQGAIAEAIGDSPMPSAQNAASFIAGVGERVNESYGMTQQAVAELQRYANGF